MNKGQTEIYIVSPHQFFKEHQQQLLPDWNISVVSIVLWLQQSRLSLKEFNLKVTKEKNRLRANFIRLGCDTIFALIDRGYRSDLFDPRDGYPLLSGRGKLTFDDNAAVNTLLHYPVLDYKNCSLIEHPTWGNNVYPATIVTVATPKVIESIIAQNLLLLKEKSNIKDLFHK